MVQIDSLEIQVSAQTNKANASVELLSKKLDRLSSSLSSVNSRGLATLGAGVNKLANAMSNFSANTKTADFSRLARNLTTISNIDTSKFSELSAKISQLSTAFGSVGTIDASGIANIGTSLSKLGGKNAIAGADNLIKVGDKLSQFITQMNGIGSLTFDATNLSNLINSISRLGGKNATEAAKNLSPISAQLQNFVRQLNSIGSLTFDTANLSNLIAGITRLGGKAATSAAANIPRLATELSGLMTTLSRVPVINRNVIDMTNALANLARTGAGSGRAANSLSQSFTNISLAGNRTLGTLRGMQGGFRNLIRTILPFVGVYQLFNFGRRAIEISSDLTEVQNVVDTTFGEMTYKVEELAKTSIEQFGLSELSLKEFSSRFQATGTAMGFPIEKMSDMSIELTKLTADMSSFYNVAQEDVAKNLQSIFTGETEPLRKYGLDLTQATLQEWALKQGLDADMQSMSQTEKTMLRYQYVIANTGAAQGDFADTAKTWANQTRILTQQLEQLASIAGGVLVNAFKPLVQALNEAMSHIIAFAETISNALGKIFGWKFEKGGGAGGIGGLVEDTEDLESGLGGAEKAAKKLNKQLRAFDELNLITTDTDGAGGAGGGTGGAGAGAEGQGGQWIQTESILQGYESSLDTLYKLGDYIGAKLSEAMESIRWEDVYEKARNFGTGLASFLNGLISPRLFGNVGTTIAGSLNTALHFLDSFGEEFDWKNFGESIAAGVNNFFSTFDFDLLASAINKWANGLLDSMTSFLDRVQWRDIGEKIRKGLLKIKFKEIGIKVGKVLIDFLKSGIKTAGGFFNIDTRFLEDTFDSFSALFEKFAGGIIDGMASLFRAVSPLVNSTLQALVNGLAIAFDALFRALNAIPPSVLTAIGGALGGLLATFVVYEGVTSTINAIQTVWSNFVRVITDAFTFLAANPYVAIASGIAAVSGALIALQESWEEKQNQLWETEQIEKYGDTLNNIEQKYKDFADSVAENAQARLDHVNNVSSVEIPYLETLADKYFDLSEKTDLSEKEYAELKLASQELVENFPQLQEFYDKTTGLINIERGAIEDLIDAKKQELILSALGEAWAETVKEQVEAQKLLDEATSNLTTAQEELNDAYINLEETAVGGRYTDAAQENYAKAAQAVETYTASQESAAEAVKTATEKMTYYETQYAEHLEQIKNNTSGFGAKTGENFTNSLVEALKSGQSIIQGEFSTIAENSTNAFNQKINESDTASSILEKMGEVTNAAREKLEIHSPSKVFQEIGGNVIKGFLEGIENLFSQPIQKMQDLVTKIISPFNNVNIDFKSIGTNAMQGLLDGLKSLENTLYEKAKNIANKITDTIKNVLDIHSPSRVMFELGGYTMQGFQNGLENLYQPILSSMKSFGHNLQVAPAPSFDSIYRSYEPTVQNTIAYSNNRNSLDDMEKWAYNIAYNAFSAALNNSKILRDQNEILDDIREKPTLDSDGLYKSFVQKSMERGGNSHGGAMNRLAVAQELYR